MASPSAALISRSIQHLLRRNGAAAAAAAAAPALSAIAGKSIVGRPFPVNPIVQDPVPAGAAANSGFHGRSFDMALFGRVDWPAMELSERVSMIVKNSDSDDEDFAGEFDPDEFDDGEDLDSDEFGDEDEEEDEGFEDTKPTKSERSKNKMN